MNCCSTKTEYASSVQANSQVCTIISRQSLTNEQILCNVTQSILKLSQKSLNVTNSCIYSLQKTVEFTLTPWVEVCKYILSDVVHTECSDQMIFNSAQIDVADTIGSDFCVATEDARKLYEYISRSIMEKKKVVVSFSNVKLLTPLFLNMSICQLYGQFKEDTINNYLDIINMNARDKKMLSMQIKKAKRYFRNPDAYKKLISPTFGE